MTTGTIHAAAIPEDADAVATAADAIARAAAGAESPLRARSALTHQPQSHRLRTRRAHRAWRRVRRIGLHDRPAAGDACPGRQLQAQSLHPRQVQGDQVVGHSICDLFIEDRFIVDVMARHGEVSGPSCSVLRAQLKAADLELGLIINFAGRLKDGLVRVLNVDKINAAKGIAPGSYDGTDAAPGEDTQMYDFDEKN